MFNVFVYCGGKCGSATLLNTFKFNNYNCIHTHGNDYYKFAYSKKDNIFDLINLSSINYNSIYVIDSYRTPIERKISSFFQNINVHLPNYKNLNIYELIDYFNNNLLNKIEEYHPINEVLNFYDIPLFRNFDFNRKYNVIKKNNIYFIKLLFKDIKQWDKILSNIFEKSIIISSENLTSTKSINDLYVNFKLNYKVPKSYIYDILSNDIEFKIYNTVDEQKEYIEDWLKKSF